VARLLALAPEGPLGVVMCIGYTGEQPRAQSDAVERARILETNFTGPVGLLERLAAELEHRRAGWICVVSSVAGDRGRASNYLYGSAKAGLSAYVDGLRGRLFRAGVRVTLVKPGFVDTGMTWGLPGVRGAVAPERVARGIRRAVDHRRDTVYLPGAWRLVMAVIRAIPERIFKRLRL
jgi:decaprenylphospho-beta-D-erythro-pentofuranosid-2-ulose 2-reductase